MKKSDQEFVVQKIRTQYTEKTDAGLEELKALDSRVKRPANLFAGLFGSFGALVMGAGMSLVMTDLAEILEIQNPMLWGILMGCVGMGMVLVNYPIYKKLLESRRKKYAGQIIALSDRMMKG